MMNTIKVAGESYPAYATMGAIVRFKEQTGIEISDIGNDMTLSLRFIFCCIQSACNREKISFELTFMDFCDNVNENDLNDLTKAVTSQQAKKKTSTLKK